MKLYTTNEHYTLYNDNMLNMLENIEENSIDAIVTDPPYEIGFNKESWDKTGVSFNKNTWKQCYKVLKPGGLLLAFGGSKTYHKIAIAIEDADFEIRDCIMWLYGCSMPKSLNISVSIDKHNGIDISYENSLKFTKWLKSTGIKAKEINKVLNNSMGNHYLTDKEQPVIPNIDTFNKIKPLLKCEIPEYIEKLIGKDETNYYDKRKVIETKLKSNYGSKTGILEIGKRGQWNQNITEPYCELAKKYDGYYSNLKPAYEPIIVARKQFKGSLTGNVIKYGVGALNIDECRIPIEDEKKRNNLNIKGRYASNVLLTNVSEPWSRYFYSTKSTRKDRDEGLNYINNHSTVKPTELMQYLIRLVAPKGSVILDPFCGSGSTGKAAMIENKNRNAKYKFIGIELTNEYLQLEKDRIDYILNNMEETI